MPTSPELVLSLEHLDKDGMSFRSDTRISATDAKLSKGAYGSEDFEHAEDLRSSHHIFTRFFGDEDEHEGGTVLVASAEVFEELRSKGSTEIDVVDIPGEKGMVYTQGVVYQRKNFRGALRKVGVESMRVLVDDEPVMLEVLHAKGTLKARDLTRDYEFWWLNDPQARLLMRYKSEDYAEYRVVRIDRPEPAEGELMGHKMEAKLSGEGSGGESGGQLRAGASSGLGNMKKRAVLPPDDKEGTGPAEKLCRARLNGVYFSTGSAELLAPSRPALDAAARVLMKHSDWNVMIEGHTDNVGDDASNLVLSRNRAIGVKDELTGHYGIDPARIRTDGFGRTRPIDTNDTIDGRAHNRRVEMVRVCSK